MNESVIEEKLFAILDLSSVCIFSCSSRLFATKSSWLWISLFSSHRSNIKRKNDINDKPINITFVLVLSLESSSSILPCIPSEPILTWEFMMNNCLTSAIFAMNLFISNFVLFIWHTNHKFLNWDQVSYSWVVVKELNKRWLLSEWCLAYSFCQISPLRWRYNRFSCRNNYRVISFDMNVNISYLAFF